MPPGPVTPRLERCQAPGTPSLAERPKARDNRAVEFPLGKHIMAVNDAQYRRSQGAQGRHITDLRAAIAAIETRLSAPTADTLTSQERVTRKKTRSRKAIQPRPSGSRSSGGGSPCGPNWAGQRSSITLDTSR